MRLVLFVCLALFCAVADEAFAQAGTGGTQDGPAASGMIYPVRPRVGPAVSKPTTNVYRTYPPQQSNIRLRRTRPVPSTSARAK